MKLFFSESRVETRAPQFASWMLEQDARALLTRLARVKPFAMQESMLPAANLLPQSQTAIERHLMHGRHGLYVLVEEFVEWLRSDAGLRATPEEAQERFVRLRLRFNVALTQFDMFSNVITQRSENETGVWLSGLDVLSADALHMPFYDAPPVICYLDRGVGAAIRRARTRMPGGGLTPVAIVKVPRERMVGSGIASSLVHEVGHQGAALLGLVDSLRRELREQARRAPQEEAMWRLWERWISEIVADVWSVARAGVASTMGLMAVVSLPRAFVFRLNEDDPHPVPWIRVKLSAALGDAFYPQRAWGRLAELWESYYPLRDRDRRLDDKIAGLERTIPDLVGLLKAHRPPSLGGKTLTDALRIEELDPGRLREALQRWRTAPGEMYNARPVIAFAAIGQGRMDGKITPEEESIVLAKLLTHWALKSTLEAAAGCAAGASHHCACQEGAQNNGSIETSTRRTSWQIQ
jgi:hypothetical protein